MKTGWRNVLIADVVEPLTTIDPRKQPDKTIEYIDVSSVSRASASIQVTSTILGCDAPSRARRSVRAGDVLFATIRPTLQRIAIVPDELDGAVCSTGYFVLRPNNQTSGKFLFYRLLGRPFCEEMASLQRGASYPAVSDRDVRQHQMSLPPLPEQKRIVAILDKAFAAIATATANTEKNLANARELFENFVNHIFNRDVGRWAETELGEIADFKNGLNYTKTSKGEEIEIVGVKDFHGNYWVPMDDLDIVQIDGVLSDAYLLKENDILTVRSNGNKQLIGRCVLAGDVRGRVSHSGFTIRIRVHSANADPTFLVHYLKSGTVRDILVKSGGGTNISSLNQKALSSLPVRLPTKKQQREIVERIESTKSEAARLATVYRQELDFLAELKQSILHKAFTGELTAGFEGDLRCTSAHGAVGSN